MACTCKNEDGTLSDRCYGACLKECIIAAKETQKRDPLNGFVELIMSQVHNLLEHRLTRLQLTFETSMLNTYKDGYREGLLQGVKLGAKIREDEDY